jgi:hypothetical protein
MRAMSPTAARDATCMPWPCALVRSDPRTAIGPCAIGASKFACVEIEMDLAGREPESESRRGLVVGLPHMCSS